jgi:hypothetical protein
MDWILNTFGQEPESLFWQIFLNCRYNDDFLDFLPAKAVSERVDFHQKFYQGRDDRIGNWHIVRPGIYLSKKEMNDFLSETIEHLLKTHQYVQKHPALSLNHSILELNSS